MPQHNLGSAENQHHLVAGARRPERLTVNGDGRALHGLRGVLVTEEGEDPNENGRTVLVTIQFGPAPDEHPASEFIVLSAHEWPGGALLSWVVRPARRGGDFKVAWESLRRQVQTVTGGFDLGPRPAWWRSRATA